MKEEFTMSMYASKDDLIAAMRAHIYALQSRLEEADKDAARYRWLREDQQDRQDVFERFSDNDLDMEIDCIMQDLCSIKKSKKEHSISCLYKYTLSLLNLPDTPELRIMFWDFHGRIKFKHGSDAYESPVIEDDCNRCIDLQLIKSDISK